MASQKNKIFWEKNAFEKWICVTESNENVNFGKGGGVQKSQIGFFRKEKSKNLQVGICWIYFTNYYLVGI